MSNIVISVENLSKAYRLGQIGTGTLSRDLNIWWAKMRGKPNPLLRIGEQDYGNRDGETIWALKDVSFTVTQGEVLGIIGRNGAGKSTLLKILSRVTAPTSGKIKVKGRIASLLEVGTGFHPDLTGRENIYLNGAILGMSHNEITRKFDEIVDFAEIEKFIDTPVKRYSSGMYVRLAFAVAAHLEPEILVVDEVLAVGDVQFQEKCLNKMGDIAHGGRTVLFVSHNLGAIQRLCTEAILLNFGEFQSVGTPPEVVGRYVALLKKNDFDESIRSTKGPALDIRVLTADYIPTIVWPFGEKLIIEVSVFTPNILHHPSVDVGFYTGARVRLFALRSDRLTECPERIEGYWYVRFEIENPGLTSPEMVFDVGLREGTGGIYSKLISNAGTLSADHNTFPKSADSDWMLYPKAVVSWSKEKMKDNENYR